MLESTIGEELRAIGEARGEVGGGFRVMRQDLGNPRKVLGRVFTNLRDKFGYTTNTKSHKVLPDCIKRGRREQEGMPCPGQGRRYSVYN